MLEGLKEIVCNANLALVDAGLVILTWGNVSGVDRETGVMVIKPSGLPYTEMTPQSMAVVSLDTGEQVDGELRPSSDTPIHRELYNAWQTIGGVLHTHSPHATAWAQAGRDIPPLGTTHADFCNGPIPCTARLTAEEIAARYEANTGLAIVRRMDQLAPLHVPACLVAEHGPFVWGADVPSAVTHAVTLETVAQLATETLALSPDAPGVSEALLAKHFSRKHGPNAYYGQG
ncbi:MAG: L-ribulose-5-phosphate 4-epimerase AraD [Planctomycetota bacterium]